MDDLPIDLPNQELTINEGANSIVTNVICTERGWAGHFVSSNECSFRRNTLVECGKTRVVVSTVGALIGVDGIVVPIYRYPGPAKRYYETIAFYAKQVKGVWQANVSKSYPFKSPWLVNKKNGDTEANQMHDTVLREIMDSVVSKK